MPVIDIHPHIVSPDTERYPLAPLGGTQSTWSSERPTTYQTLLKAMDDAGVDKAAIVHSSTAYGYDNSYVADAVAAVPSRFTGVYSIDVMALDAVNTFDYWLARGCTGMRLFTTGSTLPDQATWFVDPQTYPFWEHASAKNIPVCMQMKQEGLPLLRQIMDRFPKVTMILDHLARTPFEDGPPYGGAAELLELAKYKQVYLKITPVNVTPKSWGKGTSETFRDKGSTLMATATKLKLHTMLGNYANTKALKSGALGSDLVDFDFAEVKVANNLFKQVVREAKYDVAELAIVTYLQAKAYGKPYVLVPAVVVSRGQHHTIAYNPDRGPLKPSDLNGKRVGVRAYTVTTGTWVRGILASDYGVDIDKVEWITFEDPHVAEYHDPAIVKRAPEGKDLTQMLLDGDVAAGIVGDKLPDPKLRHLIPDADVVAQKWAERHHGVPINHMVVIRQELSRSRPDVVKDIFRQLHESKRAAGLPDGGELDPYRFGVEACRPILEIIIDFCHQQKLIPRRISVDELFDDTTRALATA